MPKIEPMLWLNDTRGIYIPRDFAMSFVDRAKNVAGVDGKTWAILESGPDNEWYWESWDSVLDSAIVTDENGQQFTVYQNGDCWLIPRGMEWCEELDWFVWPIS